jgi:hypothetical protein
VKDRRLEVVVAGLLGGALAWVFATYLGQASRFGWALDLLTSIVLGAGAAPVFVYLLANTDRPHHGRPLSIALVAGLCREPVSERGRADLRRVVRQDVVELSRFAAGREATMS